MKTVYIFVLPMVYFLSSGAASASDVRTSCQIYLNNEIVYDWPQMAPQPYTVPLVGRNREGQVRNFQMSFFFEGELFSATVLDVDHVITGDTFSRASVMTKGEASVVPGASLIFEVGDPANADPVLKVACRFQ